MKPLDLYSEPYSPSGNLTSAGALNQLGRPNLDILEVLVREAVQNTWDARIQGTTARFGIAGWKLSPAQLQTLREIVFLQDSNDLQIGSALHPEADLNVLAIYDRGTTGLTGPIRADILPPETDTSSFADFIYNLGQPRSRNLAGGTYGYGKTAFYRSSQLRTICVHTQCLSEQKLESRFIAAALGFPYSVGKIKYTGGHWWGISSRKRDWVEPLLNQEADELAGYLGMPGYTRGERGTTMLVLQPVLGERTPSQAMNLMVECLLWYFWPKMLTDENGSLPMSFEVSWEGALVNIPSPSEFPPLHGFVQAMQRLKTGEHIKETSGHVVSIESLRPKKHLGLLSLERFASLNRRLLDTGSERHSPVPDACHHVALMRQAELVVTYLAGPPLPTDPIEYAGVFITDEEVDAIFAEAEPPAHDNWVCEFLENRNHKSFIRTALRCTKEAMNEFVKPSFFQPEGTGSAPLGAFANRMGALLPGQDGPGATFKPFTDRQRTKDGMEDARREKRKTDHPPPPRQARMTLVNDGELIVFNAVPALLIKFSVEHAEGSCGTVVQAHTGAVLDENEMETDPPAGSSQPQVLEWIDPNGNKLPGGREFLIPTSTLGTFQVIVNIPDNMVVGVNLTANAKFEQ